MFERRLGSVLMSASVLLAAACFVLMAASEIQSEDTDGVVVKSVFSSSNGLSVGSKVSVAGVVVGDVTSIRLDPQSDLSEVTFTRPRHLFIPVDSSLSIRGGGPSGAATLAIVPGRSTDPLQASEVVRRTTPAISLEDAIGQFIFGDGGLTEAD